MKNSTKTIVNKAITILEKQLKLRHNNQNDGN